MGPPLESSIIKMEMMTKKSRIYGAASKMTAMSNTRVIGELGTPYWGELDTRTGFEARSLFIIAPLSRPTEKS
jgi:hypothetical protein